jgi:ABC-type amino acid transport substrate-binding protein
MTLHRRQKTVLRAFMFAATAVAVTWAGAAVAGTLDRLRDSKTIRIAYREDAPPFSYKGSDGQPTGFMVDLCRMVVQRISQQLNMPDLAPVFVKVTASDRFEAVQKGRADLLCEATTATLARREIVDFSIPTFVDGASLMIHAGGPDDLKSMAGKKIGVLGGTTTEEALRHTLSRASIQAEIVLARNHDEGIAMLDEDKVAAYFADRAILAYLVRSSKAPGKLLLAEQYLTVEPYALALEKGDSDFRLLVDRTLSRIYRTGEIMPLFRGVFGAEVKPSAILQNLFLTAGLPE